MKNVPDIAGRSLSPFAHTVAVGRDGLCASFARVVAIADAAGT
jgi:hypothetical protein